MKIFLIVLMFIVGSNSATLQVQSDEKQIEKLISDLGDNNSTVRDKAQQNLIIIGKPAYKLLSRTIRECNDPEIIARAEKIVFEIEWVGEKNLHKKLKQLVELAKSEYSLELVEKDQKEVKDMFKNFRFYHIRRIRKGGPDRDIVTHFFIEKLNDQPTEYQVLDAKSVNKILSSEKISIKSEKDAEKALEGLIFVAFPTDWTATEYALIKYSNLDYFDEKIKGKVIKRGYTIKGILEEDHAQMQRVLQNKYGSALYEDGLALNLDKNDLVTEIELKEHK